MIILAQSALFGGVNPKDPIRITNTGQNTTCLPDTTTKILAQGYDYIGQVPALNKFKRGVTKQLSTSHVCMRACAEHIMASLGLCEYMESYSTYMQCLRTEHVYSNFIMQLTIVCDIQLQLGLPYISFLQNIHLNTATGKIIFKGQISGDSKSERFVSTPRMH